MRLQQHTLIDKVRQKCEGDTNVSAAMMYGSYTKGEGDQFSDVEFYIFIDDEEFTTFSSSQWIGEIAPYDLLFYNEYGTEVVVFTNLIRGEFHFLPESEMEIIKSFKDTGVFPDTESMGLYDKTGKLKACLDSLKGEGPVRMTDANVNFALNNFVNAWLMGVNVMNRGELARSLECLTDVQKYVLRLIRVRERTVDRWLNATKNLEADLSSEAYSAYVSVTSNLDAAELRKAYSNALNVVQQLIRTLEKEYAFDVDLPFLAKLHDHLAARRD